MLNRKCDLEKELKKIDRKLTQLCRQFPWYKLNVLTGQLEILINELEVDRLKAERENQSRLQET